MKNILNIDEQKCMGCGNCSISCPKQCIKLEYDKNGFVIPILYEENCIECGLCIKNCPATESSDKLFNIYENEYYSAISNNSNVLKESSSGGLFGLFAEKIISRGGYVCGCVFDSDTKAVRHILINKLEHLGKMYGSKYVQSVSYDCFKIIKDLLKSDKEVLFTGTACQIAALRLFLDRNYSKLYLVEILCHGTPSPKLFSDFIKYYEKKIDGNILNVKFRDKSKSGWGSEHRTSVVYIDKNNCKKKKYLLLPSYFSAFFYGLSLRSSCYECKFARIERVSDITIGDFWGAWKKYQKLFHEGISVASLNSDKGKELFDEIIPNLRFFEKLTLDEAIYSNDNFQHPVKCPSERDSFYEFYRKNGYKGIWWKTYTTRTYRKKTIVSFYGALVPKRIQSLIQRGRRGGESKCQ